MAGEALYADPDGSLWRLGVGEEIGTWSETFQLGITEPILDVNIGNLLPTTQTLSGRVTTGGPIERALIPSDVRPSAPGSLRYSTVRGGQPTSTTAMVDVRSHAISEYLIEFCTLDAEYRSPYSYGTRWGGYTLSRSAVLGCVDAVNAFGNDGLARTVRILGSLLADSPLWPNDPNQGGGPSHNDGVQAQGLLELLEIIGNSIGALGPRFDTAIQLQTGSGLYGAIVVTDNWLYGHQSAGAIVNIDPAIGPVVEVKRNRISRDSHLGGQILVPPASRIASNFGMVGPDGDCSLWTPGPDCNVYMDNGEPVYPKNK